MQRALEALQRGDVRAALPLLREHLEQQPDDFAALTELGGCYERLGENTLALQCLDRARLLDSNYLPATINCARAWLTRQRSAEALPLLRSAKAQNPDLGLAEAGMGFLCHSMGDNRRARRHNLAAWLGQFDEQYGADAYLFHTSYDEISEADLCAEHRFWAATLAPLSPAVLDAAAAARSLPAAAPAAASKASTEPAAARRIRIGYWSPDLRHHSVFHFIYPLLAQHSRTEFEVFAYHDHVHTDAQTELIQAQVEHFHHTALQSDAELVQLMLGHRLDVLVELAGHTSTNRLGLLRLRLARLQLTGLGYPPSTGLDCLDGKLLDAHICPSDAGLDGYYSEPVWRLPQSFWTFDAHWQAERIEHLPCDRSEVFTYACFGNISKITDTTLRSWGRILQGVPQSRLLLRSISFADPLVLERYRERMQAAGLSLERMAFLPPAAQADYLRAYNEVDLVLDSYPFNGGTTSCFALHMGVVVLSRTGAGLRSRMGYSMLHNLGLSEWLAEDEEQYVALALSAPQRRDELRAFRQQALQRFAACALGQPRLYAQQLEQACREALARLDAQQAAATSAGRGGDSPEPSSGSGLGPVPAVAEPALTAAALLPHHLPPAEILRRAYAVRRHGNEAAAQRIARYCLQVQSDYLPAHVFLLGGVAGAGLSASERAAQFQALLERYPQGVDVVAAHLMHAHAVLAAALQPRYAACMSALQQQLPGCDGHDQTYATMLLRWFEALLEPAASNAAAPADPSAASAAATAPALAPVPPVDAAPGPTWTLLVEAAQRSAFEAFVARARTRLGAAAQRVEFVCCLSLSLARDLERALAQVRSDYVALVQANCAPLSAYTLEQGAAALQHCDLVAPAGCRHWDRLPWRRAGMSNTLSCTLIEWGAQAGNPYELRKTGLGLAALEPGMALLDGNWIALRTALLQALPPELRRFDLQLEGAAGFLYEEWSHRLHRAGYRLAVSQRLGVVQTVSEPQPVCYEHLGEVCEHLMHSQGFDPFAELEHNFNTFTIPLADAPQAQRALERLFH